MAHLGLRSPHTRETSPKTHQPLVTTHTGNFGQDTSAIGHQAHGKLRPRHIGHRPPSTWETSARTTQPWHTSTWHTSTMAHLGAHDTTMHTSARTIRPWHTSDLAHLDRGTPRRARPPPTTRGRGGVCTRTLARCVVTPPHTSRPRRDVHVHLGQVCRDPPPTTQGRGGVCTRTLARRVVTPPHNWVHVHTQPWAVASTHRPPVTKHTRHLGHTSATDAPWRQGGRRGRRGRRGRGNVCAAWRDRVSVFEPPRAAPGPLSLRVDRPDAAPNGRRQEQATPRGRSRRLWRRQ